MKNVTMKLEGDELIIKVNIKQEFGRSASGKTIIIASTEGNKPCGPPGLDAYIGLNVYKYAGRG